MSKILLLMSHIGSGSEIIFNALNQQSTISGFNTSIIYDHTDAIKCLKSNLHKNDNTAAVWMDHLLHNYRFTCKPLFHACKLVFYFGEPKRSINQICKSYAIDAGVRYYLFRIQGMLEYAARTPESLILMDESFAAEKLEQYLGLREPLNWKPNNVFVDEIVPESAVKECQQAYAALIRKLKALEKCPK